MLHGGRRRNRGEGLRDGPPFHDCARYSATRSDLESGGCESGAGDVRRAAQASIQWRKAAYASGELIHWNVGRHWPLSVREKISASLLDGREPAPSAYGGVERLEVHHWEPYRFSYDNPLDNLVTLCAVCHGGMHVRYRAEGFTAEAEAALHA